MKLPTLFKRTSTGAIEQWTIEVIGAASTWKIVTTYGHVDGKPQQAEETVREGKNIGKKNETTAKEQAESQARAEHTMKLSRKGYVDSIEKARAGENAGAGGIRPMLAKPFEDVEKKWIFPCFAQAKLDGIRCIAVVGAGGTVTLWTREQKPILAVPAIAAAVEALHLPPGAVLDGELYNHDLKDDFEKIVSCVRKQYAASAEEQALIQYHVYDMPRIPGFDDLDFGDRWDHLAKTIDLDNEAIKLVETRFITCKDALIDYRKSCQEHGYEGAMARANKPYQEGKRSSHLAKLKEFLEEDFDIIGVNEGVGKMAGLAIFECRAANGNPFAVKMEGELEGLRKYLVDESTWKGKKLSVKFFSLTNRNKVPRFPVGKAVRDYE